MIPAMVESYNLVIITVLAVIDIVSKFEAQCKNHYLAFYLVNAIV